MNYTVRIQDDAVYVSPPIYSEDEDWSMVLLVDPRAGDVLPVRSIRGAIRALYDELQVNSRLRDGDTFNLVGPGRGDSTPFAYVDGVHVLPWKS